MGNSKVTATRVRCPVASVGCVGRGGWTWLKEADSEATARPGVTVPERLKFVPFSVTICSIHTSAGLSEELTIEQVTSGQPDGGISS